MTRWIYGLLMIAASIPAMATADDALDEAIKKDRQQIKGRWNVVALVLNGNPSTEQDARKLAVTNGDDGTWTLFAEGKQIAKGTSTIDPAKQPKALDFTITEGEGKGNRHLGIYQLGEKSRKMCFAPPGSARPTEFASTAGSGLVLLTFQRASTE